MQALSTNPILNNPYQEPKKHYFTNLDGSLSYEKAPEVYRRPFIPSAPPSPVKKSKVQLDFFSTADFQSKEEHLVTILRREIGLWRESEYNGFTDVTRVTKDLLTYWFLNPNRIITKQLFFAQREVIETTIWLNEVAEKSNIGSFILSKLQSERKNVGELLPRTAFKMATGTGKTVVMALQILYHFFNRQEYRNDIRFDDNFLIIAPGVTVRDRLQVLFVDNWNKDKRYIKDIYYDRDLVPPNLQQDLPLLNTKLVITNYHTFEPRTLKGKFVGALDGKKGNNFQKPEESFNSIIKRVLRFKLDSRLLILNDEAHHCYLPNGKGKDSEDGEMTAKENAVASIWYNAIRQLVEKFKVRNVFDLSATPYYMQGSGRPSGLLFPWIATDYGLVDAIEAGLVKIPFLPERDNTYAGLTDSILKNIYSVVKSELPKKSSPFLPEPFFPDHVTNSLEMFYKHYESEYEAFQGLFGTNPVMIIVCSNTRVSYEMYRLIAGYEKTHVDGTKLLKEGAFEKFSNVKDGKFKEKPPTLLIDSYALDNAEATIDESFKSIFAHEIENFRREYAIVHGQGAASQISESEILREVLNTVGKRGKLGSHVHCIISVSMLTEGWDANTVTHIYGLRAFGSQLLCEQVVGRALRRKEYHLENYDKEGNPTKDKRRIKEQKFPPEFAHIVSVPFDFVGRTGKTTKKYEIQSAKQIHAISERTEKYEIRFPQVTGYRINSFDEDIMADFEKVANFQLDGSIKLIEAIVGNAFQESRVEYTLNHIKEKRHQEIIYRLTQRMLSTYYADEKGYPKFHKFNQIKNIITYWYAHKVDTLKDAFPQLVLRDMDSACRHIQKAIFLGQRAEDKVDLRLNINNPIGSTTKVQGITTREVFETTKSHVNAIVCDSDWERVAAQILEDMPEVLSYVKNAFLYFAIPYTAKDGKDRFYYPDFIAVCQTPKKHNVNLIIETSGPVFTKDKEEKVSYIEHYFLPAINRIAPDHNFYPWHFIEIKQDTFPNLKNELRRKLNSI
ncbi:BPTD_3080 family restriction endonuclease [Xanthocytophaga agilis]|uniref:DEAD/DEAH box helicase family protein n=1 Tax=Xanthocytophaga agilis TaxID=3048010 RepID=A0AAE3R2C6_9BACT|nr:DEAD/DEAH box helicase family protein [Xanthocytophaga agilis]MDJ1501845.1 DEAD/DEAH box helicase family protein [Xanthocytophaga agilis]